MFKKTITRIVLAVFSLSLLSSCASKPSAEVPKEPFTLDYPTDAKEIPYFTQNDTLNTFAEAGPYYMGLQQLDQPAFVEYAKLRQAKVDEAIKITDDIVNAAEGVNEGLKPLKDGYLNLWDQMLAKDKSLLSEAKTVASVIIGSQVKVEGLLANAQVSPASTNPVVKAYGEYQRTAMAMELAKAVIQDLSLFMSSAAQSIPLLEKSDNKDVVSLASDFDGKMNDLEKLDSKVDDLYATMDTLGVALKQLNTGEYYMSLGSLAYVKDGLEKMKPQMDALIPNQYLAKDDVDFIKGYGALFGSFADQMTQKVESLDKSQMILAPAQTGWIPNAYADGFFSQAYDAMANAASKGVSVAKSGANLAWTGVKGAYNVMATGAGITTDAAGVVIKSGMDVGFGVANWNNVKDTYDIVAGNFKKMGDNMMEGTSGAETMKTAQQYMDNVEDGAKDLVNSGVKAVAQKGLENLPAGIGENQTVKNIVTTTADWTGWGAGHVAKITVGMFTGFGKGIYKVANVQSDKLTILEGSLDIGLSFIGGSKVIFKGSQVASGMQDTVKLLGEKGMNFVMKIVNNADIQGLKSISAGILENAKLTPDQVKTLLSNAAEIEANQEMQAELVNVGKEVNKKFLDLMKEGASTVFENTLEGRTAYKEFVKDTFEKTLSGYKDALLATLGKSYTEYIDNLVASKADDFIKGITLDYVGKGLIPGFGGPFDGHYTGRITGKDLNTIKLNLDAVVDNGALTGKMVYASPFDKAQLTAKMDVTGDVDVDGEVKGNVTGNVALSGDGTRIAASLAGPVTGKAEEGKIELDMTLSAHITDCQASFKCDAEGSTVPAHAILIKSE
jgi:hypothetical protein